jgi:spermidine synthase
MVLTLFFVSGACGLIYQVVWSRMLTLMFGRSVLAVGIVLAAFMAGLALGSYLLGKFSDKSRNPLRLYAIYEIGIGITALAASALMVNISPFYIQIYEVIGDFPIALSAARFILAFLVLIVPTILMGATLPILSRVMIKRLANVGHELGGLYAINTLGAVAGAMAAGFLLIRFLGLQGTVYLAVAGNLGVGFFALVLSQPGNAAADEARVEQAELPLAQAGSGSLPSRALAVLMLFVFGLSGLASFAYEIFWTRSLVFILGNTTYAFTLVLTAFLSGIALGGYLIRFVADRIRSRLTLFAVIQILIGVFSAASLPILFSVLKSVAIQSFVRDMSSQFGLLIVSESTVALVLMLLPATQIGATLPLAGRIFVADLRYTGTMVGRVYAVNALGNVVGALLPGLLILPLVGIQKGVLLMAALNICLGLLLLAAQWRKHAAWVVVPLAMLLFLAIGALKLPVDFQFPSESQTKNDAVLFYEEGGMATTKVWVEANQGRKLISVDGINIGGTGSTDYKQQILAHLPKLLLESYRSELSIGLGSGILIGESGRHEQLKKLVCVEISPGVVKGAEFFTKENYAILDDSRSEVIIDDIGHYLQTSPEKFDIISADGKTTEKYTSNSYSYSQEYYELLKLHLTRNGMVIQWVPTALPADQYAMVLRTFLDVFPHANLWYFPPVGEFFVPNTFLIGSNETIDVDPVRLSQILASGSGSFRGIEKYGLKTAEDVLTHFVASEETLRQSISPGPINSFNRPYYEFYSPTDYALSWRQRALVNHQLLMSIRGPDFEKEVLGKLEGPARKSLWSAYEAEGLFLKGYAAQLGNKPYTEVVKLLDLAVALAPRSEVLRNQAVAYFVEQFRFSFLGQDYDNALRFARSAAEKYPQSSVVHENYGMALLLTRQPQAAVVELLRTQELNPDRVLPLRALGIVYAAQGKIEKAMLQWRAALSVDPNDIMTLVAIGVQLAKQGSSQKGEVYLQRAYKLAPRNPAVINGYAHVMYLAGDIQSAGDIVLTGGRYYEGNPSFERMRAKILGEIR